MKNYLTLLTFSLFMPAAGPAFGGTDTGPSPAGSGLVYQLASIKAGAESMMEYFLSDPSRKDAPKAEAVEATKRIRAEYDGLRAEVDGFLLQLMADMKSKNSVKPYRYASKAATTKAKNASAEDQTRAALQRIRKRYDALKSAFESTRRTDGALPVRAEGMHAGFAELPVTPTEVFEAILKVAEQRKAKVDALGVLLKDLRLRAVSEITADLGK